MIAGEGHFGVTPKHPPFANGDERLRFVFAVSMASRDEPILRTLQMVLGFGSVHHAHARRPHWQPSSTFVANSLKAHQNAVIPFCEAFLPPTAKREQYETWRDALLDYDERHPHRHGKGLSQCSVPECTSPVRGRGLCRKHYYRATGY